MLYVSTLHRKVNKKITISRTSATSTASFEDFTKFSMTNVLKYKKLFECSNKTRVFWGRKMKLMMVFSFVSGCWMNMIAVAVAFVFQFSSVFRNLRVKKLVKCFWKWLFNETETFINALLLKLYHYRWSCAICSKAFKWS